MKTRALKFERLGLDTPAMQRSMVRRLLYSIGKDAYTATERDWLDAAIQAVRDRLIERWMETMRSYYQADAKRVYYLSLEFLMGRTLRNALCNLNVYDECEAALVKLGVSLAEAEDLEEDAGLGNGGLGRLAACFLDSFATLGLPGYGYGIRYEFGMFKQTIEEGQQIEQPDSWLRYGNPWEFPRPEVLFPVRFGGSVSSYEKNGRLCFQWRDTDDVMAMAYDTPIPGYGNHTVNNMRLWGAHASRDFHLHHFNAGNYLAAVQQKNESENLSRVLYPSDATYSGKELRLRQQYFFVSASLQDILYRFEKHHDDINRLPDKVAIQLNDTHPAIAIADLMRILLDERLLDWEHAWDITCRTFSYTNHTLMPEALETWPVSLFEQWFPRHLQIIYEINHRFLEDVRHRNPGDQALLRKLSLIDETGERQVRMAHLAIVGSHKINGVAALHSKLLQERIFPEFHQFFPGRFTNVTNGITPRRWLQQANPTLSRLIDQTIGESWQCHLERLEQLSDKADHSDFQQRFAEIKHGNKLRLANILFEQLGITVNPHSLFDVQIKRIHEYKRQLLNLLYVIHRYNLIHQGSPPAVARTVIFAGKAAPGYERAKEIIRLIHDVADIVNNDPVVGDKLKVVFVPNYNVSNAELIIPAAELSQQISTAGTEASGTGNMKLALNGALTIGTLDGANIEIRQEVGEDNMFIFGLTEEQANRLKCDNYQPQDFIQSNESLKRVLHMIESGFFSPEECGRYQDLIDDLRRSDPYLLMADFSDYCDCQARVDELYQQPAAWNYKAIKNVAHMGHFSSDRAIGEYAKNIWQATPVVVPEAEKNPA